MSSSTGGTPGRILVRGVNWLGDAVMTIPALARLRERFPQAQIAVFAPLKLQGLWTFCPYVDDILTFDDETCFSAARKLRSGAFDLALVFPNSPRSALEPCLARIPIRIGYARAWRNWLLTRAIPPRPGAVTMRKRSASEIKRLIQNSQTAVTATRITNDAPAAHHILNYLHLAAVVGANPAALAPSLLVPAGEMESSQTKLCSMVPAGFESPSPIFAAVNPSAAYGPAKKWPAENFAAVLQNVSRTVQNLVWVTFSNESDRDVCDAIKRQTGAPIIDLAGRTSLRELILFLSACKVILTNDSGPMHLAAALGVTVVALFGSTSARLTGPGMPGQNSHFLLASDAPCSPCFRRDCPIDLRCFSAITPKQVTEDVLDALSRTTIPGRAS